MFLSTGLFRSLGLCAWLLGSTLHAATVYDFSIVAKSGSTIAGHTLTDFQGLAASIGADNTVSFYGRNPGANFYGIFTGTSLIASPGSVIGGNPLIQLQTISFVSPGDLVDFQAFQSGPGAGSGIYDQSALLVGHSLLNVGGPNLIAASSDGTVLGAGQFFHNFGSHAALITPSGIVANLENPIGGVSAATLVAGAINDSGSVVFTARTADPFDTAYLFSPTAVLAGPGLVLGGVTINTLAGGGNGEADFPVAMNNAGTIALLVNYSGGTGILSQNGLLVAHAPSDTGIIDINATGEVAYTGGTGVWTQYGKVLGIGDSLFGKTVQGVSSSPGEHILNDSGNLAFGVTFTDGSQAIVLATDASVPEPRTGTLLCAAVVAFALLRFARRPRELVR